MSINYETINELLKKIDKPKQKISYLNNILDCVQYIKGYSAVIEKEHPEVKKVIGELEVYSKRKHHLPRINIIKKWTIMMRKYLNYLKECNLEELIII